MTLLHKRRTKETVRHRKVTQKSLGNRERMTILTSRVRMKPAVAQKSRVVTKT